MADFEFVVRDAKSPSKHIRLLLEYAHESLVVVRHWPRRRFDWFGQITRTFLLVKGVDGVPVKDYELLRKHYQQALTKEAHCIVDRVDIPVNERAEAVKWLLKKAQGQKTLNDALWCLDDALKSMSTEGSKAYASLAIIDYQGLKEWQQKGRDDE